MPVSTANNTELSDRLLGEASDLSTPVNRLGALYESKRPDILMALANNPSTPENLLFVLWESYPDSFLENPFRQK